MGVGGSMFDGIFESIAGCGVFLFGFAASLATSISLGASGQVSVGAAIGIGVGGTAGSALLGGGLAVALTKCEASGPGCQSATN